ncbi:hypothetical protein GCM10027447_29110 [Glycomyces halotolerans]
MTGVQLAKIFAWTIGVLCLLWLLAQCLAGPDYATDPERDQYEQDAEQYVADCQRSWEALDLMGELDHANVDQVVDQIDIMAAEIVDPELAEMTYSFAARAEELVRYTDPGDDEQIEEDYRLFRGLVEVELSMRCTAAMMSLQ